MHQLKSQINRVGEMIFCKLLKLHEDPKNPFNQSKDHQNRR